MTEPRVYKHSPMIAVVFSLLFVGLIVFLSFGFTDGDLLTIAVMFLLFVFIFGIVIFTYSSKVLISDDEISSQNILGMKTLRWTEIHRVSGRGYNIKLHNFDEDVTVSPSPQLPHYEEIVEWIGRKRPDLFSPQEFNEMNRGAGFLIGLSVFGAAVVAGIAFLAFQTADFSDVNLIYVALILLVVLLFVFYRLAVSVPMSLTFEGNTLILRYLIGQKTLLADEINFIQLTYSQSRNGKIYFVLVTLTNGKRIRLMGLNPNLPTAYLVLKNWHRSHVPIRQTNQWN